MVFALKSYISSQSLARANMINLILSTQNVIQSASAGSGGCDGSLIVLTQ